MYYTFSDLKKKYRFLTVRIFLVYPLLGFSLYCSEVFSPPPLLPSLVTYFFKAWVPYVAYFVILSKFLYYVAIFCIIYFLPRKVFVKCDSPIFIWLCMNILLVNLKKKKNVFYFVWEFLQAIRCEYNYMFFFVFFFFFFFTKKDCDTFKISGICYKYNMLDISAILTAGHLPYLNCCDPLVIAAELFSDSCSSQAILGYPLSVGLSNFVKLGCKWPENCI